MPLTSCFSSPKRLPGSKKEFPNVGARVNSLSERQTGSNADGNSSPVNARPTGESPTKLTNRPKQRTHHDSSAVSGCLKGPMLKPKSKIAVSQPVLTRRKAAPITAVPEWNMTTRVDNKAEMKPLPGTKKTLADFVRKPFRAAAVPLSTYKPPKGLPAGKQTSRQVTKKEMDQKTAEAVLPFRAKPVPASTYKPFRPVFARQSPAPVETLTKPLTTQNVAQ